MPLEYKDSELLKDYYRNWISVYKEGAIREVTLSKYRMSLTWIERIAPELKLCDLTRIAYQKLLNEYAKKHELHSLLNSLNLTEKVSWDWFILLIAKNRDALFGSTCDNAGGF